MERKLTSEVAAFVGKEIVVEGWVHDVRVLGGINFLLLRDKDGMVQITAPKAKVPKEIVKIYEKLHQEDVVKVRGKVVANKSVKNGFEIIPDEIEVVSKSEVPLPLDPRVVTPANLDTQLDWRFLQMRTEETRAIFRIQSRIAAAFRSFFLERGYLEIQPPAIIASASEGGAELFSMKYFEKDAYLAQSPQLYKQMGAMSFEKVFSLMPVFRAEKFEQPTHLNEIRQMDAEQAFTDYEGAMEILEQTFAYIISDVKKNCAPELALLKRDLRVPKLPLKRVAYTEAIEALNKSGEKVKFGDDFSKTQEKKLSEIFGEVFFMTDWPTEIRAFYSMPDPKNPKICRAFDLVYGGLEISSGTQRIHDPVLLEKQIKEKGLDPKNFKFYIDVFRYGAPVHSGFSLGLERLTMKICDRPNIRETTMFPRDRNRLTP